MPPRKRAPTKRKVAIKSFTETEEKDSSIYDSSQMSSVNVFCDNNSATLESTQLVISEALELEDCLSASGSVGVVSLKKEAKAEDIESSGEDQEEKSKMDATAELLGLMKTMLAHQQKQLEEDKKERKESELRMLQQLEEEKKEKREVEWRMEKERDEMRDRMEALELKRVAREADAERRRKKERALNKISSFKDGGDIVHYIQLFELEMEKAEAEQNEYLKTFVSKLPPQTLDLCIDLVHSAESTYGDVKDRLLDKGGISRRELELKLFSTWRTDHHLSDRVKMVTILMDLLRKLLMKAETKAEIINMFAVAIYRTALTNVEFPLYDMRAPSTETELMETAMTLKAMQASRKDEDKFRHSKYKPGFHCGKCGREGHRAWDCRQQKSYDRKEIVCYACKEKGHIAPECPNKYKPKEYEKKEERKGGEEKTRRVTKKANWLSIGKNNKKFPCEVNGRSSKYVPDSGAEITLVPEKLVDEKQYLSDVITIQGTTGIMIDVKTAKVKFNVRGEEFVEIVAVAPPSILCDTILFSIELDEEEATKLIKKTNSNQKVQVATVETRRQVKEREEIDRQAISRDEEGAVAVAVKEDKVKNVKEEREVEDQIVVVEEEVNVQIEEVSKELGDVKNLAAEIDDLGIEVTEEGSTEEVEKLKEEDCLQQLCVPKPADKEDLELLRKQTVEDPTLKYCRSLADKKERGYLWKDGLLLHKIYSDYYDVVTRIVLPSCRRKTILEIAHNKSGHFSARRTKEAISRLFTWPGIAKDCEDYYLKCLKCLRKNKRGSMKAEMIERPAISEPFECIAVDIVGPLPKGKGGCQYILTCVCMSSRWPEAVPLKTQSARETAEALIQIFSRTGLPLTMLTDQGRNFVGRVVKEVCEVFGIEKLQTSAYRPQSNGVVERLHGTLKPILAKVIDSLGDWVRFLPIALFAIRQIPNRDVGFSPHEMIFGRAMRGPLDIVYAGWIDSGVREQLSEDWVLSLCDRLEVLHDIAYEKGLVESAKRKSQYDKHASKRELKVGDSVMTRIPGRNGQFEDSWSGPHEVVEKMSRVNYKVKEKGSHKNRVVHINSCRPCRVESRDILACCVVAEEIEIEKEMERAILSEEKCDDYNEGDVKVLLDKFIDVFKDEPGDSDVVEMTIKPIEGSGVVCKRPYSIPMHLRKGVEEQIEKLKKAGIIEESESEWASPIVPVKKPDGSVRLCVDYRELNSITPLQRYYIPNLPEILDKVGNSSVLSKVDLSSGYHQIRMEKLSSEMTTFVCPMGKFKYTRMPFGLKNAPAVFQQAVEKVLRKHGKISVNYIDDILIFSDDWESHIKALELVLTALQDAGFTAKFSKCSFGRKYVTYLGHMIGSGKLAVPENRVSAMADFKRPATRKQLKAFLGSVGYYREFVQGFAKISSVLTPHTSPAAPRVLVWGQRMEEAFKSLRESLCKHVILCIPTLQDEFTLHTDASGDGLGAVLNVKRNDAESPVAFWSRQLRGPEKNYSAFELEATAILCALEHFCFFLYGTHCVVFTDHRACMSLSSSHLLNRRLRRIALKLQEWSLTIIYKPGAENQNADGLSRQGWSLEDFTDQLDDAVGKDVMEPKDVVKKKLAMTDAGSVPCGVRLTCQGQSLGGAHVGTPPDNLTRS